MGFMSESAARNWCEKTIEPYQIGIENFAKMIKEYLDNNDIDYVFQKRFNDCKNQKTLRFDFWLPKHEIIIEYDGKQHYEPINFFGGAYLFEKMQNNDKIKNEYAVRMGYYLLRIKYLEQNNIPLILKNNIRELN